MPKQYRLLKDLNSGSKQGDIYKQVEGDNKYYHREDWKTRCDAIIVENSPLLFEQIVEKEPFVWTEELVWEFGVEIKQGFSNEWIHTRMEEFKNRKLSQSISAGSGTANDVQNDFNNSAEIYDYEHSAEELYKNIPSSKPTANDVLNSEFKFSQEPSMYKDGEKSPLNSEDGMEISQEEVIKLVRDGEFCYFGAIDERTLKEKYQYRLLKNVIQVDQLDGCPKYTAAVRKRLVTTIPSKPLNSEWEIERCGVCGGDMVLIRGKYPKSDKRYTCPTCSTEKLEQIQEISSPNYGKAVQNIKS